MRRQDKWEAFPLHQGQKQNLHAHPFKQSKNLWCLSHSVEGASVLRPGGCRRSRLEHLFGAQKQRYILAASWGPSEGGPVRGVAHKYQQLTRPRDESSDLDRRHQTAADTADTF